MGLPQVDQEFPGKDMADTSADFHLPVDPV